MHTYIQDSYLHLVSQKKNIYIAADSIQNQNFWCYMMCEIINFLAILFPWLLYILNNSMKFTNLSKLSLYILPWARLL